MTGERIRQIEAKRSAEAEALEPPPAGVLRNFFVSDVVEIFVLFADLVRVSERHTKKFLAAGLDRITAAGP